MRNAMVASGLAKIVFDVAVGRYGIAPEDLLEAAGLQKQDLRDPGALIPGDALGALLRFVLERTGDAALGIRAAEALDLRKQGSFGYAILSSLTLRERIALQLRYLRLRWTRDVEVSMRVEGDSAIVDFAVRDVPSDIYPLLMDWIFATVAVQFRKRSPSRIADVRLWIDYPESPHHLELRSMVKGPVVFEAPCNRVEFPARELDRRFDGDPQLGTLMRTQLEAQLSRIKAFARSDIIEQVRDRLSAHLSVDPSLQRVARDLRVSGRTLRRRLESIGASFHALLVEVRRERAIEFLAETSESIERVAQQLGYSDPSNFRRAFRRWTGLAPSAFREERQRLRDTRRSTQ